MKKLWSRGIKYKDKDHTEFTGLDMERFLGDRHDQGASAPANSGPSHGSEPSTASGTNASKKPCPETDHPVDIASGQKVLTEVDYLDVGEMPLNITRSYSDEANFIATSRAHIFGTVWSTVFDMRLRFHYADGTACMAGLSSTALICDGVANANNSVVSVALLNGFGNVQFISGDSYPGLRFSPNSRSYINRFNASLWIYVAEDGTRYLFDNIGRLTSIENINGIKWTLEYVIDTAPVGACVNCASPFLLKKVTHSSGKTLQFTWSPDVDSSFEKKVVAVTLPDGSVINYPQQSTNSQSAHSLEKVVFPNSTGERSYLYEGSISNRLKSVSIDNKLWLTTLADQPRTLSGLVGGVEQSTFSYTTLSTKTTTVTNAKGGQQLYTYDGKNRLKTVSRSGTSNCPNAASAYEYQDTSSSRISYKEDWNGNRTAYTYYTVPELGYATSSLNTATTDYTKYEYANGITKEFLWDDYGRLKMLNIWDGAKNPAMCKAGTLCPTPRSLPAQVIEYVYSSSNKNRLQSQYSKALKYNSTTYTPARTISYAYEFYANNQIKKVTIDGSIPGAGDLSTKEYDDKGNILKITNAKGYFVQFQYDNPLNGFVNHMIDANNLVTDFSYDGKGRLKSSTVKDGTPKTTLFEYYGGDQLKKITYPNGGYVSYGLDDAWRVSSITRPDEIYSNQVTNVTYDLLSNAETIKNNFISSGASVLSTVSKSDTFDSFGNLNVSAGQNGQSNRYTYDANRNVKTVTDALGRVSSFTYNVRNQIETYTNPSSETVTYRYDALGNISEVLDARNVVTYYHRNGFGEIEEQLSPDTGTTTFGYSDAGQLSYQIKANNVRVDYAYDILGRIQSVTTSNSSTRNETINYFYDTTATGSSLSCGNGIGRLCGMVDGSGSTNYSYTLSGNIASQQQVISGTSFTISNSFDAYGRADETTYPNGIKIKNIYDVNNGVKEVDAYVGGAWKKVVSKKNYANREELSYGNGIIRNKYFDTDGRVLTISSNSQSVSYAYKPNLDLISSIAMSGSGRSFNYDNADRLAYNSNPTSQADTYTYDKNGNRTSSKPANPSMPDNKYFTDSTNNLLRARNTSGSTGWRYNYDATGSVISKVTGTLDANGNLVQGTGYVFNANYDGLGRMAYYEPQGLYKMQYFYNGNNQRVYKYRPTGYPGTATDVKYLYSPNGLLIGEYSRINNGATVDSIYVYLGGEVVGLIRNNTVYSVQNDHLGRPQLINTTIESIVWGATNGPFDRSIFVDYVGTFNIGFPGQYYDSESSLWYNWNRYYDSSVGRYLQSDLIGLGGGLNTYSYVGNNPVSFVDPTGLVTTLITTFDTFAGIEYGSHSAIHINAEGEQPFLYDPAGGYNAATRGSGGFFEGDEANLATYKAYQIGTGSVVKLVNIPLSKEQELALIEKIIDGTDPRGFSCANSVSGVLGSVCKIKRTKLPGVLYDSAKNAQCAKKN